MKKKQRAKKPVANKKKLKTNGNPVSKQAKGSKKISLSKLVRDKGGVVMVAKRLNVSTRAVFNWLDGSFFPRPNQLVNLFILSRGSLDIAGMFSDYLKSNGGLIHARGQAFRLDQKKSKKKIKSKN